MKFITAVWERRRPTRIEAEEVGERKEDNDEDEARRMSGRKNPAESERAAKPCDLLLLLLLILIPNDTSKTGTDCNPLYYVT